MTTAEQHNNDLPDESHGAGNRLMQTLLIAAIVASDISMVFSIRTAMASASDQQSTANVAAGERE